jgi:archaellum component FlaF (FlaF/FlaG flagellin family)
MGLSVSIASAIVLVGWIAFIGAIATAMLSGVNDVGSLVNSMSRDDVSPGVQLGLRITSIEASAINFTVTNTGSKDLFLRNGTYAWNSVIITYNNTDWQTYLIDNYTVLAITTTGSNDSFDLTSHHSINPGEQAFIHIDLPTQAPIIEPGSIVDVVFASRYGVSARQEIMVATYGEQMLLTSSSSGSLEGPGFGGYISGGGTIGS